MTSAYSHLSHHSPQDGGAYCPIERRRRGPAALAASVAVLVAGSGFLAFSMMSAPKSIPELKLSETSAISSEQVALTQEFVNTSANPPAAPAEPERASASTPAVQKTEPATNSNPTVTKSRARTTVATDFKFEVFVPRVKPVIERAHKKSTQFASRPLKLGEVMLASAEDAPGPFFFKSDIERRVDREQPAALALVQDIEREQGELRIRLTRGENFVDALQRAGVRAVDRNAAAYEFGKHYNLRRLRPGQEFVLRLGWPNQTIFQLAAADAEPEAHLLGLEFRSDVENRVILRRQSTGEFEGEKRPIELTTRMMSIAGRINGSLYVSAKAVGAPDSIVADLADAFSYDVDFQREIFGGDEFEAIFEVKYDDQGELVSSGDILFARLKWRGRSKEKGYYRFAADADNGRSDFYDAAGKSAKRLLMKTPIDGARLSSGFGTRKHPILGYRRAHKGVDFAAPRGTPIKAAGDGVVERANRYGSFGNYIRIRHANGYKTAYAHLKGFARGVRSGRRVSQGDIIGYVGTTGRSTGPHLHYEVHLNGNAVNPQRLKISATGKSLNGADLDRFKVQKDIIDSMREIPETKRADAVATGGSALTNALQP